MKRQYIYPASVLAAIFLTGCAKESGNNMDYGSDIAVELSSVCTGPAARAVITGTSFSSEEAEAGIGLFLLDGDGRTYGTNAVNVRYGYNGSKWTAASPLRVGGDAGNLYGYYPYNESVTDIAEIPVESSINGTDYLYANSVELTSATARNVSLMLNHALARVSLSFKLSSDYSGSGTLSGIGISGDCVAVSGTLNAKTGTVTATGDAVVASDLSRTIGRDAVTTVECLVVPVSASGTPELKLSCVIDGKSYDTTFTGDVANLAGGRQSRIEFTVSDAGVKVGDASIGLWGSGEGRKITVGDNRHVTVRLSEELSADVMLNVRVNAERDAVIIDAFSKSGALLECIAAPSGSVATWFDRDMAVYTFTVSDVNEDIVAMVGRRTSSIYINVAAASGPEMETGTVGIGAADGPVQGLYQSGSEVRLFATASSPSVKFVRWTDGGLNDWDSETGAFRNYRTVTAGSEDVEYKAVFCGKDIVYGAFEVNGEDTVYFANGNLWGSSSTSALGIEDFQYLTRPGCDDEEFRLDGHISHFMWSADLSESMNLTYMDHGMSGDDKLFAYNLTVGGRGWSTLSRGEWNYILYDRDGCSIGSEEYCRFFKGRVEYGEGVVSCGLFLIPDGFVWPEEAGDAPSRINDPSADFNCNTFSLSQFMSLDASGVVFLPAAGLRFGDTGDKKVSNFNLGGLYCSSDCYGRETGGYFYFDNTGISAILNYRYIAGSVRLVFRK